MSGRSCCGRQFSICTSASDGSFKETSTILTQQLSCLMPWKPWSGLRPHADSKAWLTHFCATHTTMREPPLVWVSPGRNIAEETTSASEACCPSRLAVPSCCCCCPGRHVALARCGMRHEGMRDFLELSWTFQSPAITSEPAEAALSRYWTHWMFLRGRVPSPSHTSAFQQIGSEAGSFSESARQTLWPSLWKLSPPAWLARSCIAAKHLCWSSMGFSPVLPTRTLNLSGPLLMITLLFASGHSWEKLHAATKDMRREVTTLFDWILLQSFSSEHRPSEP